MRQKCLRSCLRCNSCWLLVLWHAFSKHCFKRGVEYCLSRRARIVACVSCLMSVSFDSNQSSLVCWICLVSDVPGDHLVHVCESNAESTRLSRRLRILCELTLFLCESETLHIHQPLSMQASAQRTELCIRNAWQDGNSRMQGGGEVRLWCAFETRKTLGMLHMQGFSISNNLYFYRCGCVCSEESNCRFCDAKYPSWKESLTPATPANRQKANPIFSVHFNGQCYRISVKPGEEGRQRFQKQLMHITGSKTMENMQAMFQCRAPETQDELEFKSMEAFDAVMHCASISAAARASAREKHVVEEGPISSAGRPLSLDQRTHIQASSTSTVSPQDENSLRNNSIDQRNQNCCMHCDSLASEASSLDETRTLLDSNHRIGRQSSQESESLCSRLSLIFARIFCQCFKKVSCQSRDNFITLIRSNKQSHRNR